MHTFRSIARLVIFGEPFQILVFDPGHPVFVLVVVAFFDPFVVGFTFLLVFGEGVEAG